MTCFEWDGLRESLLLLIFRGKINNLSLNQALVRIGWEGFSAAEPA